MLRQVVMYNVDTGEHYIPVTLKWLGFGANVYFNGKYLMFLNEESLKNYDIHRPRPKQYEVAISSDVGYGYDVWTPHQTKVGFFKRLVDAKRVCNAFNKEEGLA